MSIKQVTKTCLIALNRLQRKSCGKHAIMQFSKTILAAVAQDTGRIIREIGKIIRMIKAGWSARRVARLLRRSGCVVRRYWDQWIREMSFT
ncbi:hypothetical protein TNCV_2687451 [Trichonephila clavipes]|nr:hypothetical protein TNCV_2687451 [Trichonephila clavipes]